MTRWLRRLWMRSYSAYQLREYRAGVLLEKGELLAGVFDGRDKPALTAGEEREQQRLSARLEDVDMELQRRELAPWR